MFHVKHSKSNLVIWFVFSRNYLRETRLKPSPLPPWVRARRATVRGPSIPPTESVVRTLCKSRTRVRQYDLLCLFSRLLLPVSRLLLPSLAFSCLTLPSPSSAPGRGRAPGRAPGRAHQVERTRSPGRQVARSPGRQVARSPGRQVDGARHSRAASRHGAPRRDWRRRGGQGAAAGGNGTQRR